MKKAIAVTILLIASLGFAGCRAATPVPTPAVTPTATGTPRPAAPTKTALPSRTPSPTFRVTSTTAAAATKVATMTALPSTATARPTAPPSATVTPSTTTPPLPTSTLLPGAPTIDYFRANVEVADPGDDITLEWHTTGAITVTLWHLAPTGQLSRFWGVAPSGAFEYHIDESERNSTTFALWAGNEVSSTDMVTLAVMLRCTADWFFTNHPDICPVQAALVSGGAEQHFERGVMIWVGAEDRIYVLFDDGQSPKWHAYQDNWSVGNPESDPTLTPPAGTIQPVRGFGLLWRDEPGIRERLGWAVDQETGYETALQRTSYAKYNGTYIRAADGDIWRLEPEFSGWQKWPAS